MRTNRLRSLVAAALVTAASLTIWADDPAPLRRDADQLKQKITSINQWAATPGHEEIRTTVTQQEVNAYLVFEAASELPAGVVDPSVSMLGAGRVTVRAVVDLDEVRQQGNPPGLMNPLRYLRGRLAVKATGLVHARDGIGRLEFEAADIAGVPVPKFVLQQIVGHYSRSAARPSGISLDDTMALPAGIREIHAERGQAIIIQ